MYNLIFDKKAINFLEELPKNISHNIFKKINETKENPFHFFTKLKGRKEFKLRVGNYRVIADINKNKLLIYVIMIGHRKNIYQKI
jgi:mRNA interferase RelE/StbE